MTAAVAVKVHLLFAKKIDLDGWQEVKLQHKQIFCARIRKEFNSDEVELLLVRIVVTMLVKKIC